MRIALVTADNSGFLTAVDHSFVVQSVLQLLSPHHEIRHFPFTREPNPHMMSGLRHHDVILMFAPDILLNCKEGDIPLTPDLLASLKVPVIPFGLSSLYLKINEESSREWRDRWLTLWHKSSGTLGVEDAALQAELNGLLGRGATKQTGSWGLYLRCESLVRREARNIFCPWLAKIPASYSPENYRRFLAELFEELNAAHPTLLVAQHSDELGLGSAAGLSTLYSPKFPMLHAKAIASSHSVLSARIQPAIAAVSMGVPAMLLAMDETSHSLARQLGIPAFEFSQGSNPVEISEAFADTMAKYPWNEVNAKLQQQRKTLIGFLKEKGMGDLSAPPSRGKLIPLRPRKSDNPLSFATCLDREGLTSFYSMVENLRTLESSDLDIHVLLFEKTLEADIRLRLSDVTVKFYEIEECLSLEERLKLTKMTREEKIGKCKPAFLLKILDNHEGPLFYFDVDLYFFRSPRSLVEPLGTHHLMLFPNWNRTLNFNRRYGLYNSDLLVLSEQARPALEWWNRLVNHRCSGEEADNYYIDQGYLDLLPLYFGSHVKVYRELDQGIATWNLETLGIYFRSASAHPFADGGRPIGSIQVEGVDRIGAFDFKTTQDQLVCFFNERPQATVAGDLHIKCLMQQSRFRPEIRRLMAAYHRLPGFLRSPHHLLTRGRMEFFIKGLGGSLLGTAAFLNRTVNFFFGKKQNYFWDESTDFWIPLQKEILFPKRLPQKPAMIKKTRSKRAASSR